MHPTRRRSILALAGIAGLAATPAWACRIPTSPKITEAFDAIVVVRVTSARVKDDERWRTWRIRSRLERVVAGRPDRRSFDFTHLWGSTGCRPGAAPKAGERFVLYLNRKGGKLEVVKSFTLDLAQSLDQRVAAATR